MHRDRETGFGEDLNAVRISLAARVLVERPSISVADVAGLVGYSRTTHFVRAFRRRYGLPPGIFRLRARSGRAVARSIL